MSQYTSKFFSFQRIYHTVCFQTVTRLLTIIVIHGILRCYDKTVPRKPTPPNPLPSPLPEGRCRVPETEGCETCRKENGRGKHIPRKNSPLHFLSCNVKKAVPYSHYSRAFDSPLLREGGGRVEDRRITSTNRTGFDEMSKPLLKAFSSGGKPFRHRLAYGMWTASDAPSWRIGSV